VNGGRPESERSFDATAAVLSSEIDSFPESRVRNSQPHGIGRVAALDGLGAWSNLGRNVVFVGPDLRPRAVFDESAFSEDEPSQYDLDVHAIVDVPGAGMIVTLNHLGMLRAFRRADVRESGPLRRVAPVWTRTFAADVERAVVVGDRLVGSRPREQNAPGLLVSEPLSMNAGRVELDVTGELGSWGMVTALAPLDGPAAGCMAVGGDEHVSVVAVSGDGVGPHRWDTNVDFEPAALLWDGMLLWAAGSDRDTTIDDYDWNARHGGGFAALDPVDGRVIVRGRFEEDLAWGNGGVAVVLVPGALCGFGRRGELHVYDTRDGAPLATTAPAAERSLGIAHAAALGDHLVYGFNRGGYRLRTVPIASVQNSVRSRRDRFIARRR
jgi:hypothetical protein